MPFGVQVAAESAVMAEYAGRLPRAVFGDGTDRGDSCAKPEILKEPARFKEYADKMQAEKSKLAVAAKTDNFDSSKTAVSATGNSCKTYHDAFGKD
jgi:cytochrome c556